MKKSSDVIFNFDAFEVTFLARYLHRLRVLISQQSDEVFAQHNVTVPSHCASLMLLLHEHEEMPITVIANALGYSHQLILQRLGILEKAGCIRRFEDPEDRRRRLVRLTRLGMREAEKIEIALKVINVGLRSVMDDVGGNLQDAAQRAEAGLMAKSISLRAERT